jgi:hypothetical protein
VVQPKGIPPTGTQSDVAITAVQPPQKKGRGGVVTPTLRSSAGELLLPQFNGPVVNLVTPSQLRAGSNNVELTIVGSFFTPDTKISFDRGIAQVGKPQFVSSTEIKVKVNVPGNAPVGALNVTVKNSDKRIVMSQVNVMGARKVVTMPTAQMIAPKFTSIVNYYKEGVIYLEGPEWGTTYGGQDHMRTDHGLPLLDDDTEFTWGEANHGTADYFEIRFYARDGKTLLATRRIDGLDVPISTGAQNTTYHSVPTTFRPDPALVAELMNKLNQSSSGSYNANVGQTSVASGVNMGNANAAANGGSSTSVTNTRGMSVSDGDMQWEVAGFKTFTVPVQKGSPEKLVVASPVLLGQSQGGGAQVTQNAGNAIEVEISERWPLGKANAPSGLLTNRNFSKSKLQVVNIGAKAKVDSNGKPSPNVDPNNYPYDQFMLQGDFDFTKAPYALHPKQDHIPQTSGPQIITYLQDIRFDNVFVDWGDGTIEPIEALPVATNEMSWYRGTPLQMSMDMNGVVPAYTHKYSAIGTYNVRVFELAESDAQVIQAPTLAMALDEANSPYAAGAKLAGFTLRLHGIGSSGTGSGSGAVDPELATIISRGYLLYCAGITIVAREDLLATGPPNLDSIKISFQEPGELRSILPATINTSLDTSAAAALGQQGPGGEAKPGAPSGMRVNNEAAVVAATGPQTATVEKPAVVDYRNATVDKNLGAIGSQLPSHPWCSKCDESMIAKATLRYYGRGLVRFTWYIDNVPIRSEVLPVGPSEQRKNVPADGGGDPIYSTIKVNSPALNVASLGDHLLHVEAEVIPEMFNINPVLIHGAVMEAGRTFFSANKIREVSKSASVGESIAPLSRAQFSHVFLQAAQSRVNLTQKIGMLSPNRRAAPGVPSYISVQNALAPVAIQQPSLPKIKPYFVYSEREWFSIVASGVDPCTFLFPTKGGTFHVTGLQHHLTHNADGTYSGTGKLVLFLTDSPQSASQLSPISVKIDKWVVPDAQTVQSGSFDVSPGIQLPDLPAVTAKLDRVAGTVGAANDMQATLELALEDNTLRVPDGAQLPPTFTPQTAPITTAGDWYKSGIPMPEILIGWSAFKIKPDNGVAIDLSRSEGSPASQLCGYAPHGTEFVGIHLGNATITPYTMGLLPANGPQPQKQVSDWGVSGSGICGAMDMGAFNAPLMAGKVSFDSLHAQVQNGLFKALYKNLTVHVPWLEIDLKGDIPLQSGGGQQAAIQFNFPPLAPVTKAYQNTALTAKDFVFTLAQNLGWAVWSNTTYSFNAENKKFAVLPPLQVYYAMDGHPYFASGAKITEVPLSGASSLGDSPLDLVSVRIGAPQNSPDNHVLDFDFDTKVHLSTALPAADMHVNYAMLRTVSNADSTKANYSDWGPHNTPFKISLPFPPGDPSVNTTISPVYHGENDTTYEGNVDLALFGGPDLAAQFKLSYDPKTGDDYWIAKTAVPLAEGIPILPPFLTLYKIYGGMGHNVSKDLFLQENLDLSKVTYDANGGTVFSAGVRAGSSDSVGGNGGFVYTADGFLQVQIAGSASGARFDFPRGWLLSATHDGAGDFSGYIQYANKAFDGELDAHLNYLAGMVAVTGTSSLHFGNGIFQLNLGTHDAPISGTLLGYGADSYLMVGNETGPLKISAGGGEHFHLGVGDSSVASAYVDGFMDMGLTVQPSPPSIGGNFDAGVDAGVCIIGGCASAGVNAHVTASAPPVQVSAQASIDLPWPLPSVDFTVSLH